MELDVKDRVAVGDNKYILTDLGDGRVQLDPAPDNVEEEGTPINKELLQPIVDAVPVIFELTRDDETNTLSFQNGQTAEQLVGLLEQKRNVIVRVGDNLFYKILDFVGKITTPITPPAYIFQSISSTSAVTYTLTESGFSQGITTAIVDYVIDEGTSGNWTYRKWASGVAECWARFGFWNETISNDQIKRLHYNISFPFEFAEVPAVFAVASSIPNNELTNGYPDFNVINAVASTTQLQTVSVIGYTQSVTITEGFVSIHANGRWK